MLAGCQSDNGKNNPVPVATVVLPPSRKLASDELLKVEVAIYDYFLQPQFWTNGVYAAVFVQGDNGEFDVICGQFPNPVPPIKPNGRAQLLPNRTLVDRDTGLPAMILSVVAQEAVGDMVQADGRWFAGAAVSGSRTFTLQQANGGWRIESVK